MARLRGIAFPKIWYLLAKRLNYNGHKPGLWALHSSKGSRKVSASQPPEGRKPEKRAVNGWFRNPPFVLTLRHVLGIASYSPNGVLEANVWMRR
jgi:hypothetical protein